MKTGRAVCWWENTAEETWLSLYDLSNVLMFKIPVIKLRKNIVKRFLKCSYLGSRSMTDSMFVKNKQPHKSP